MSRVKGYHQHIIIAADLSLIYGLAKCTGRSGPSLAHCIAFPANLIRYLRLISGSFPRNKLYQTSIHADARAPSRSKSKLGRLSCQSVLLNLGNAKGIGIHHFMMQNKFTQSGQRKRHCNTPFGDSPFGGSRFAGDLPSAFHVRFRRCQDSRIPSADAKVTINYSRGLHVGRHAH